MSENTVGAGNSVSKEMDAGDLGQLSSVCGTRE